MTGSNSIVNNRNASFIVAYTSDMKKSIIFDDEAYARGYFISETIGKSKKSKLTVITGKLEYAYSVDGDLQVGHLILCPITNKYFEKYNLSQGYIDSAKMFSELISDYFMWTIAIDETPFCIFRDWISATKMLSHIIHNNKLDSILLGYNGFDFAFKNKHRGTFNIRLIKSPKNGNVDLASLPHYWNNDEMLSKMEYIDSDVSELVKEFNKTVG